jgi:hypothetical protein
MRANNYSEETVGEVYASFLADKVQAERQNNILDLGFSMERINSAQEEEATAFACDIIDTEEFALKVSSMYKPKNGFYD